jgi:hypothetical protein
MVSRMTLEQIAKYLNVDERAAHAALNRIGVPSPGSSGDSVIVLLRDLDRAQQEIELRKKWAANGQSRVN